MALQQYNPNQQLPDTIRMKAQKGFYAHIDGKLAIVNPGDVVDIPRQLACDMRAAGKAFMVDEPLKRQAGYMPDYARPEKADPVSRQLAALTEAVTALTALVASGGKGKQQNLAAG
jgi:hypothetical protein